MEHVKPDTKLEQFTSAHYDFIGASILIVFGTAIFASLGASPFLAIVFGVLMVGGLVALVIIVGAPARRQMDTWRKNEAWRDSWRKNVIQEANQTWKPETPISK